MKETLLQSRAAAWGALILMVLVIVLTFAWRPVWWCFCDEFFGFMAVFCQLVAVYIRKFNYPAFRKLQNFAAIFLILGVVALIVEFILWQCL